MVVYDLLRDTDNTIALATVEEYDFCIGKWYATLCSERSGVALLPGNNYDAILDIPDIWAWNGIHTLLTGAPYPGETTMSLEPDGPWFRMYKKRSEPGVHQITDMTLGFQTKITSTYLKNSQFNLVNWYSRKVQKVFQELDKVLYSLDKEGDVSTEMLYRPPMPAHLAQLAEETYHLKVLAAASSRARLDGFPGFYNIVELNGQQVEAGTYPSIQRNATMTKDPGRLIPKPLVIVVEIAGQPAYALVDSGSLGDFISSSLVEQLQLKKTELVTPLQVQLAVQGSRSHVNFGVKPSFEYQDICGERHFDVINLSNYDLILGTPWLFQHKVMFGINPPRVVIGSMHPIPMKGSGVTQLTSRAMSMNADNVAQARQELLEYAKPLCKKASNTLLPPLRVINHKIPLINEAQIYPWRPSRCPEAMRSQWVDKHDAYIKSGRWEITSLGNTVPMLLIRKPGKAGEPPRLCTVVDLWARNANTKKLSSPLPDIDGILRRVARASFRSVIDGQDAYEQIRVVPEHVERTTVTTPDGNMISNVIQIGDCNAPAMYQALMNYLFSAYIGHFLDVYLDDIIVYSNNLEDHINHIKLILDILHREKLYLSEKKLLILQSEMKVLRRIIDDEGIRMDPDKVDVLLKWKTPTNWDLLRGFLGSAGYLADDIDRVRLPMGILHGLTGDTVPFRWDFTHQRAFEDIKRLTSVCRDHHRKPLRYGDGAPPVNAVTNGCGTGIAGVVSQGIDWRKADVAAFFSAKLNTAQQNYPVHKIEMLAGVETMLRHRDILQGVHFRWYTDHKGLIHLLEQKNLSGRQARWLEKISKFDFEVVYVPGVENILSDALSRMYTNDEPGTVRARSEYTYHDIIDNDSIGTHLISMPVLVGMEGENAVLPASSEGSGTSSRKKAP